jgi:hypothetical protein
MKSELDDDVYAQLSQNGSITTDYTILTFCELELRRFKQQWEIVNESKSDTDKGEKTIYTPTGQTPEEAFLTTLF